MGDKVCCNAQRRLVKSRFRDEKALAEPLPLNYKRAPLPR